MILNKIFFISSKGVMMMKENSMLLLGSLLLWIFSINTGIAGCSATLSAKPAISLTGTADVQRDAPIGTLLFSRPLTVTANVTDNTSGGSSFYIQLRNPTADSGVRYNGAIVRNTNVAGIGIAYSSTIDPGAGASGIDVARFAGTGQVTGTITYNLVKTGPITPSAAILSGGSFQLMYVCLGVSGSIAFPNGAMSGIAGTGSFIVKSCTVNTSSASIPLGDVLANNFSTVGATLGSGTTNISLTCDPSTNINISLDGIQNTDTTDTSVLALTGAGSAGVASGIGVQLLYNNQPLQLNNRIVVKQSLGGAEILAISARYYQTKTNVTAGLANATATLNITYQ